MIDRCILIRRTLQACLQNFASPSGLQPFHIQQYSYTKIYMQTMQLSQLSIGTLNANQELFKYVGLSWCACICVTYFVSARLFAWTLGEYTLLTFTAFSIILIAEKVYYLLTHAFFVWFFLSWYLYVLIPPYAHF